MFVINYISPKGGCGIINSQGNKGERKGKGRDKRKTNPEKGMDL